MMNRSFSTMMTSAVVLGALMTGCSTGGQERLKVTASDNRSAAPKIEQMLAAKDYAQALTAAEALVSSDPNSGDARAMLGRAYLANGRYLSARTAFADAMTLGNRDPRTIVSRALVESGLGDVQGAHALLTAHIADLPAGDYGLAVAMTGDAQEGVRALLEAANQPDATAKTRQNLAYALAMGGAWGQARLIAGQDLSAREAEERIGEWTRSLSQSTPSERVVAMLGVSPRGDDAGLPVQLALNSAPDPQSVQFASAADGAPVAADDTPVPMKVAQIAVAPAPVPAPVAAVASVDEPKVQTLSPEAISAVLARAPIAPQAVSSQEGAAAPLARAPLEAAPFAPAVQQGPVSTPEAAKVAFNTVQVPAAKPAPALEKALKNAFYQPSVVAKPVGRDLAKPSGLKTSNWVVQLGAFDSEGLARSQWSKLSQSRDTLKYYKAVHSLFQLNGRTFHRLAIRGFEDRSAAASACGVLRSSGQDCFVRLDDSDVPAQTRASGAGAPRVSR